MESSGWSTCPVGPFGTVDHVVLINTVQKDQAEYYLSWDREQLFVSGHQNAQVKHIDPRVDISSARYPFNMFMGYIVSIETCYV